MPALSLAQRIIFGQYINSQVFPDDEKTELQHGCPFKPDDTDLQRLAQKDRRYDRVTKTMGRSEAFLKTICSWKKDTDLALGKDFEANLDRNISDREYSLENVFGMIYRAIDHNITNLFSNGNTQLVHAKGETNWDAVANDPRSVQGGMINALATQLGWSITTVKKMAGNTTLEVGRAIANNQKALKSMLKLQFSLFNMVLNELGINHFPFMGQHRFDEEKFDLLKLKKGSILLPKEEVVINTINKAKEPDAHAIMQSAASNSDPRFFVRDSSMPFTCPAEKVSLESLREEMGHGLKANLVAEFMDYIDTVVQKIVIPRLDKITITDDKDDQ